MIWKEELARQVGAVASCCGMEQSAIRETHSVTLSTGQRVFAKILNARAPQAMLLEERASLLAIAATDTVRVPAIIAEGAGWLALEWLTPEAGATRSNAMGWRDLGASLAAMHSVKNATYGWPRSNFIGSIPQANPSSDVWPAFWRDQRILPLMRAAREAGLLSAAVMHRIDRLCDDLDETLDAARLDGPSLLHGDLWSGNVMLIDGGRGAVFDPACYYGHREVDLAMAALFGGFDREFFSAYNEAYALQSGVERRRAIYQLYYLLAHVLMFGRSYEDRTIRAIKEAGY